MCSSKDSLKPKASKLYKKPIHLHSAMNKIKVKNIYDYRLPDDV